MVHRYVYSILVILVFFNFTGCVSKTKFNREIDSLKKQIDSINKENKESFADIANKLAKFDPAVLLKNETQKKTLYRIVNETDDPKLTDDIKKLEAEKKYFKKQLDEARQKSKAQECLNLERKIDGILARQYGELEKNYKIIRVDFKYFNEVFIPGEEKSKLEKLKAYFEEKCRAKRKIIIYGYGCYFGEGEQIKKISEARAKSVASWIKENTKCSDANFVCEGVGIFLKRDYVNSFGEALKEQLLSESRHAEIFIPW